MYELITSSADVIRGIFVGHMHSAFWMEVKAHYIDAAGHRVEASIPQPVLEGNPYDSGCGHIMRIYVK